MHYEKQEEGFSISLDVVLDLYACTALLGSDRRAGRFHLWSTGRYRIDSSGTIRANYTNGQNNPLGKIVVANFNNQNGLKQIGNATYTDRFRYAAGW